MGIIKRLRQWSASRRVRPAEEPAALAGGRDGELLLRELIGTSFSFKDASLLTGRRIPSKRQGRRREIDLIVCTPRMIHLIEVKNWSGSLALHNGGWRQTRRGGDVVEHGDLLGTNLQKRDAVVEYLHDRGLPLDGRFVREHIVPKIIFMNPKLELDPAIESRPEVISRRRLDGFLGDERKDSPSNVFSSIIECCLHSEKRLSAAASGQIPSHQYGRIVASLAEIGTWDQLHLFGTQVVAGDLVEMRLGSRSYRHPELVEMAGHMPIHLRWTRGGAVGLFKAVTGLGSLGRLSIGNTHLNVSPDDTVTFHAVGDQEPSRRTLAEVDQIILG